MAPLTFCSVTKDAFLLKYAPLNFFPEAAQRCLCTSLFIKNLIFQDFVILLIKAGSRLELSIWKVSLAEEIFFLYFFFISTN